MLTATDHRLTLDPGVARRLGHRVVDALVERHAELPARAVAVPAGRRQMEARLREPLPEHGCDPEWLLETVLCDVLGPGLRVDHPRFFAGRVRHLAGLVLRAGGPDRPRQRGCRLRGRVAHHGHHDRQHPGRERPPAEGARRRARRSCSLSQRGRADLPEHASRDGRLSRPQRPARDPLGPLGGLNLVGTDTMAGRVWNTSSQQADPRLGMVHAYMFDTEALEFAAHGYRRVAAMRRLMRELLPGSRGQATGVVHKAWQEDPWAGGGWGWVPPGDLHWMFPAMRRVEGRVHFAGEHTSLWIAWMNGALESAERVTGEILRADGEPRRAAGLVR